MESETTENRSAAATAAQKIPARLIVCERTGQWAAALRRELKDLGVRVWETRSLADCWDELADSPASFVVLELGGDLTELLGRMTAQLRTFPAARLAVVTDRRQAERQWLLREAGAVEFVSSPRQAARLAQLACRHLAQVPPPQLGLTERIWASLPWGKGV